MGGLSEEEQIQLAIQMSKDSTTNTPHPLSPEEDELERILKLSLLDK